MANSQVRNVGDQFQGTGENIPIFIFEYDETQKVSDGTLDIVNQDIGHCWVLGHPVNSILGSGELGIDGEQITMGTAALGATTTIRIHNEGNVFKELLRDNRYVDTVNTTATVDYSAHTITF